MFEKKVESRTEIGNKGQIRHFGELSRRVNYWDKQKRIEGVILNSEGFRARETTVATRGLKFR